MYATEGRMKEETKGEKAGGLTRHMSGCRSVAGGERGVGDFLKFCV